MKPKTSKAQLSAWSRWAAANPEKVQANRNKWSQSPAGKAWLAANQKKKNKARDAWRKRAKARTKAQARSAALKRWDKVKGTK